MYLPDTICTHYLLEVSRMFQEIAPFSNKRIVVHEANCSRFQTGQYTLTVFVPDWGLQL